MQHSQRLDQRLHMLKEEVRMMTQEKERDERIWRDRLQCCQRQLKAKEDEMSHQSQYFENFKTQLQDKLNMALDREQKLQNRIFMLERQLLDMTVSAATSTATISAVRITADSTTTRWKDQERLPSMRGEGEGEEERKQDKMRQLKPSVGTEREGGREGDEMMTEIEIQGGRVKETKQNSNEARLQGFILSLQEDLRVLLEREECGMTVQRELMEQLHEVQKNNQFLGCKVEEMKSQVNLLKLSESSLMEEVEELREENQRLQQILKNVSEQTQSESSTVLTCKGSATSMLSYTTARGHSSLWSSGKVCPRTEGETDLVHSRAVPPVNQQAAAESTENKREDPSFANSVSPVKNVPVVHCLGSKTDPSIQPLSVTTETLDELKLGTWCIRGTLNLEESPSEESDALRDAYRELGLGEAPEPLQEQCDGLEDASPDRQLQMTDEKNILKLLLREESVEQDMELEQGSLTDNLVQTLNQENRALAYRIRELSSHIEVREEEIKKEKTEMTEHISKLKVESVGLEQENQEQRSLIIELTKKTEDDLNTIMELQRKVAEGEPTVQDLCGSQSQLERAAAISECFQSTNQEETVHGVIEAEDPQLMSKQQLENTTALSPISHLENDNDPLQYSFHVNLQTDEVTKLTKLVKDLKLEQVELSDSISSLREQQREASLSIQTQTELKQQLTRTVWGLKEEKDSIAQSLDGLKQVQEQLTKAVRGLKVQKDQLLRPVGGLTEQEAQLSKALFDRKTQKPQPIESLCSQKEERDQIMCLLQCLQTERDQLSQAVLSLKQEKDELTNSLKHLKEERENEQSRDALEEDRDELMKLVSTLREEKERIELSISALKQEQEQLKLFTGQRTERNVHRAAQSSRMQAEGRRPNPHGAGEYPLQRCQTNECRGSTVQEQSELMREIKALEAELKRSRDELEKSRMDSHRLRKELRHSETRREEAERKAGRVADEMTELQSKMRVLVIEKIDAVSLKAKMEEQYNILTALLQAKTVALEELNSEYIALKRRQGSTDDLSTLLLSLRTRYSNLKAEYEALLKERSQKDVDVAPLKAKLCCLVMKCQERNNLLAQLMKVKHRQGCLDATLTQQVEQLLSDAALQDFTSTFTPGRKSQNYSSDFTPELVSKLQCYTTGLAPDQMCSAVFPLTNQQDQSGFTTESTRNDKLCASVVTSEPGTQNQFASLPLPASPEEEHVSVRATPSPLPAKMEGLNTAQPSHSYGQVQASSGKKNFGFHQADTKGRSSPDLKSSPGSSLSPSSPSSCTPVSRRLSSPEKIISLHEQLQKTLMSSSQASVSRGRGQDLDPTSQTRKQNLIFSASQISSLPVMSGSNRAKIIPAVDTITTLYNAVVSRSANITLNPNVFTGHHNMKTTSAPSGSSNCSFATVAPSKVKATSTSGTNITPPQQLTKKFTPVPDRSRIECPSSDPSTVATNFHVLLSSDTNPKSAATHTTAPEDNNISMPSKTSGAASQHDRIAAVCTPEKSYKSVGKSTVALEKTTRPKPEIPAEVRCVEIIRTVGRSSLMIGWERPRLDELGCSNGTFVYGYRVFVNGDFYKSVMSSACTKCILEDLDLSVPVCISVQTLGSNGLCSDGVHTMYRTNRQ